MPKLEANVPMLGKGNLLSVGFWIKSILGVAAALMIVATAQRVLGFVPANRIIDTKLDPLVEGQAERTNTGMFGVN